MAYKGIPIGLVYFSHLFFSPAQTESSKIKYKNHQARHKLKCDICFIDKFSPRQGWRVIIYWGKFKSKTLSRGIMGSGTCQNRRLENQARLAGSEDSLRRCPLGCCLIERQR